MALLHYEIDLRNAADKERDEIVNILERYAETGAKEDPKTHLHRFFLNENVSLDKIPGLPLALIRRIP